MTPSTRCWAQLCTQQAFRKSVLSERTNSTGIIMSLLYLRKQEEEKIKCIQYTRVTALRCNTSQNRLGFATISRELNFGGLLQRQAVALPCHVSLIAKLPPCSTGHHRPQDEGAPLRVRLVSCGGEGHPQSSHALPLNWLGGLTPDFCSH